MTFKIPGPSLFFLSFLSWRASLPWQSSMRSSFLHPFCISPDLGAFATQYKALQARTRTYTDQNGAPCGSGDVGGSAVADPAHERWPGGTQVRADEPAHVYCT